MLQKDRLDLIVDLNLTGVHNAHIHTGPYGMVEESGMHGLADFVVPSERKRNVGNPTADLGIGQMSFDPSRCLNEIHCVILVFFDAGRNGQNIGVKNDVFGRKAHLLGE